MRIPIRIIGIATTFFWIFLIVFFVSAAYSIKDVRFDFEDPEISLTSDNRILFSLPITVDNRGYYNIGSFNVTTEISDREDCVITRGSTFIPVIEKESQVRATHNMTLDMDDLLQNSRNYLFNDTELMVHETVGLEIAEVIPVQVSTNLSVPWGAPLYNFTLGEIRSATSNGTHITVTVPASFENHALFNWTGSIQVHMYNNTESLLGEGEISIQALQNSVHKDIVELTVPTVGLTDNGYFEVYFSTSSFSFGPMVFPYG